MDVKSKPDTKDSGSRPQAHHGKAAKTISTRSGEERSTFFSDAKQKMIGPVLVPKYEEKLKEDVPLPKLIRHKHQQDFDQQDQEAYDKYLKQVEQRNLES